MGWLIKGKGFLTTEAGPSVGGNFIEGLEGQRELRLGSHSDAVILRRR